VGWSATDWIAVAGCAQVAVLGTAALYARRAVNEAKQLRSDQTRPYVVVYADLSKVARSLIDLVVENVGQTPARDVSIEFSPKLKSSLGGGEHPDQDRVNGWAALSDGIPYLAPGQRMTHLLDSAISRYGEGSKLPRRYEVTVSYSEIASRPRSGKHTEKYVIDIGVWFGSHYTTEYGIHDIGRTLKDMAETIGRWTEELDGIRVYGVDLEKHQAERTAWIEEQVAKSEASAPDRDAPSP
jgi:hypothetical protein